jgi:glutamate/tyrosine decarboxylase-like PLP-dependent enzyme
MQAQFPIEAGFLGPKAGHGRTWSDIINYVLQDYIHWRRNYFPEDEEILDRATRRTHEAWFDVLSNELDKVMSELKADYPFYSPRYQGHMVSENLAPGIIGYFAGMLYNPNNVSSESAPITLNLEIEAGQMISKMLGYDEKSWSHITSGGTIANLEAMWAARQNQLNGLAFQEVCLRHDIPFEIELANESMADIRTVDKKTLIGLRPQSQIRLPALFRNFVKERFGPIGALMNEVKYGSFSITQHGISHVYGKLEIEPVIFVSQAAHYSILKTANLLGLGEKNLIFIPVDKDFRMDMIALRFAINSLKANQVILAIVGILGTTEKGAIDPIDEIFRIRTEEQQINNRSFWVHADAAWGGYLRTVAPNDDCLSAHVKMALASLPEADSITVDPHKMGFIPYPSGIISFKDKHAVLHSHQVAPYITLNHETPNPLDDAELDQSVGPYIIEGSKPGASAVATWLTHKTIPLNPSGHGKIIKASLENALRFYQYINEYSTKANNQLIYLEAIGQPDCNIVCYYFKIKGNDSLAIQNELNKNVYAAFSLGSDSSGKEMPYRKEYFISHTHFFPSHYSYGSVGHLLEGIHDPILEYEKNGLFVLRSVIMNPWIEPARNKGQDHLRLLIDKLYTAAKDEYHKILKSLKRDHSLTEV